MAKIKDYTVKVPQEKIDKLMRRLDDVEYPSEVDESSWNYGPPV
jgi:hypothetical protein